MDGVTTYENMTKVIPDYSELVVYEDPILHDAEQEFIVKGEGSRMLKIKVNELQFNQYNIYTKSN